MSPWSETDPMHLSDTVFDAVSIWSGGAYRPPENDKFWQGLDAWRSSNGIYMHSFLYWFCVETHRWDIGRLGRRNEVCSPRNRSAYLCVRKQIDDSIAACYRRDNDIFSMQRSGYSADDILRLRGTDITYLGKLDLHLRTGALISQADIQRGFLSFLGLPLCVEYYEGLCEMATNRRLYDGVYSGV